MELRHLRYFVQVAEDLHFARAAERLGISQPPLSQQIRALEEELGVRLFDRTSRSVALTPAGKLFLGAARATLEQAERAVRVARRAARGELGELAIGFNASAPFIPQIARAIHDFRQNYPGVHLNLTEMVGHAQIDAIKDHSLDLGFLRSPICPDLPSGVEVSPLLRERLYVAMRPDHSLADAPGVWLADLGGEPLLVYGGERSSGFTETLFGMMRSVGVEPMVAQMVSEISTLFGLAAAGVGVTVLAESLRALQTANLAYRPLLDESAVTSMWLVHLGDAATLPCRNFLDIVFAQV